MEGWDTKDYRTDVFESTTIVTEIPGFLLSESTKFTLQQLHDMFHDVMDGSLRPTDTWHHWYPWDPVVPVDDTPSYLFNLMDVLINSNFDKINRTF